MKFGSRLLRAVWLRNYLKIQLSKLRKNFNEMAKKIEKKLIEKIIKNWFIYGENISGPLLKFTKQKSFWL